MAVTVGLTAINPVNEGDTAQVCATLNGNSGTMTFSVTMATADSTGGNAAMGNC